MKQLQFHWTFLFLFVFATLQLFNEINSLTVFLWLAIFGRLVLLKKRELWILCAICLLGLFGLLMYQSNTKDQLAIFVQAGETVRLNITINPLDINDQPNYLSTKGRLKNGEMIDVIYFHQGDFVLTEETLEQQTEWVVEGVISRPSPNRNFHVFSYADYLAALDIYWQLEIQTVQSIQKSSHFSSGFKNFQAALLQPMKKGEANAWVALHNKILWNLQSEYYRDQRSQFVSWGIIHYFAVSGLHIHIIIRLLRYLLLRVGVIHEWLQKIIIFILCLYGSLIGWPVGVIRAISVYVFRQAVYRFNWKISSLDCLGIVGTLLLLVNPKYVQSLSFVLSFLMTYIVHFTVSNANNKAKLSLSFYITFACLLFSWPIILNQHFEWNSLQIVISMFFGLFFEKIIMPVAFFTTSLFILPLNNIRLQLFNGIEWLYLTIMLPITHTPIFNHFIFKTGYLSNTRQSLLWLAALAWMTESKRSLKKAIIIVSTIYLIVIFCWPYLSICSTLTVIDVGQGDALLYQPAFSNQHWLIDTGGRMDWEKKDDPIPVDLEYAHNNIIPALKALGVQQIDGLILSHPDVDHMGSLYTLVDYFPVKQYIISEYIEHSQLWKSFLNKNPKNIDKLWVLKQGEKLSFGALDIYSLANRQLMYDDDASNNSSLIVHITLGDSHFLNVGDINQATELILIEQLPQLKATFLKLSHHGSRNSTDPQFIQHLQPQLAIISAGVDNRYNHPHPEVLAILQDNQINYLNMQKTGAIQITYDIIYGLRLSTAIKSK
ncbi:DNA internalization-related competence protein ComEC/Rec2 [Fundicoccus culcitae]|uniref:DNA internalization-related competence protein ComEC/Rec2 n=1 Tax=Fundicoccus culcitae TaxID=2969821 RepID=A0ABY5P6C3_9LACT|nr:DNA internalization-related competence protein ComEC/Rec2 [Fundicoccus culcitae]UUX34292.1 DNA internalization-related competence protein ComEC/Rec2 [Fundicoccus culcitae]